MEVIETVHALAKLMARDGLTVRDVLAQVGPAMPSAGRPMELPLELRCTLPGIRVASLARYPDDGLPYFLELDFDAEHRPAVGELRKTFGSFLRPPADRGMPVPLSFERVARDAAWSVTLIANLEPGTPPEDSALVHRIVLRRDPM